MRLSISAVTLGLTTWLQTHTVDLFAHSQLTSNHDDNVICRDGIGNEKGTSGIQQNQPDDNVERIKLDRRGGKNCGCSYVSSLKSI